jgi:UMF1 family MFS transporter
MKIRNPGQVVSWCLFDFANSSYSAVIAAVIFPVYFVSAIAGGAAGQGDVWWGRAISVSMAFVAVSSPFLGGIADYSGKRKRILFFYTLLCILSVSFFSLLRTGMLLEGFILMVLQISAWRVGLFSTILFCRK